MREDVDVFIAEQKANDFRHQPTPDGRWRSRAHRTTTVIDDIAWLQQRHNWLGSKGIVMLKSRRESDGKIERETRFSITSLPLATAQPGPIVRSRWAIENSLHGRWT